MNVRHITEGQALTLVRTQDESIPCTETINPLRIPVTVKIIEGDGRFLNIAMVSAAGRVIRLQFDKYKSKAFGVSEVAKVILVDGQETHMLQVIPVQYQLEA